MSKTQKKFKRLGPLLKRALPQNAHPEKEEDKLLTEVRAELARMHQNANIANHETLYNLLTYLKIRNNLLELNGRK